MHYRAALRILLLLQWAPFSRAFTPTLQNRLRIRGGGDISSSQHFTRIGPSKGADADVVKRESVSRITRTTGLVPSKQAFVFVSIASLVAWIHPLPIADLFFGVAYPSYLVFANMLRFQCNDGAGERTSPYVPLLRNGRGPWFARYVLSFATVGLFLPIALLLLSPSKEVAAAASPHLFLVLMQCACERSMANLQFSALLRLAIPVGFNTYRLGALGTWVATAYGTFTGALSAATLSGVGQGFSPVAWCEFLGLALAVLNGVMWSYNLFVFLLLRVAPQYFDPAKFSPPDTTWLLQLFPQTHRPSKTTSPD